MEISRQIFAQHEKDFPEGSCSPQLAASLDVLRCVAAGSFGIPHWSFLVDRYAAPAYDDLELRQRMQSGLDL